jgi:hypothetical protein
MTEHSKQAALCPSCEAIAQSLAEAGPVNDTVLKRCPHNGVIAVASKRGGKITHWHLEGPLTDAEADAIGAKILAQFAAAGMQVHEVTRQ